MTGATRLSLYVVVRSTSGIPVTALISLFIAGVVTSLFFVTPIGKFPGHSTAACFSASHGRASAPVPRGSLTAWTDRPTSQ